jgi:hypothetical protein
MLVDPGLVGKARHRKLPAITPIDALAAEHRRLHQLRGAGQRLSRR